MSYKRIPQGSSDECNGRPSEIIIRVVELSRENALSNEESNRLFKEYNKQVETATIYDFTFGNEVSQIKVFTHNPSEEMHLFFVPFKYSMLRQPLPYNQAVQKIYAVPGASEITSSCLILKRLLKICPGKVRTITLDQCIFSCLEKYLAVGDLLCLMEECDNLRIHGHGEINAFTCTMLVNQPLFREEIISRNFPIDGSLYSEMISKVPSVEVGLLTATPELVLNSSSKYSVFHARTFSTNDINKLLHLWLKSNVTRTSTLIMKIEHAEKETVENLFKGLKVVGGAKQPCCGFSAKCENRTDCLNAKLGHLQLTGVTLLRKSDNSEATIFYSAHLNEFNFVMLVNKKPCLEKHRFIVAEAEFQNKLKAYVQSRKKEKMIALATTIQNNEKKLSKKMSDKDRNHLELTLLLDKFEKDSLDWDNFIIQRASENFKRIEQLAFRSSEKRKSFGHFELDEVTGQ